MRRLLPLLLAATPLAAQQTRAEKTDYAETSTHADVLGFVDSLQRLGAGIRVGRLGLEPDGETRCRTSSPRGPLVDAPARAARTGKPVDLHPGQHPRG